MRVLIVEDQVKTANYLKRALEEQGYAVDVVYTGREALDWDEAYTVLLDEWLVRDYSALGYRVVRVPVLSPQERLAFVLERLAEQVAGSRGQVAGST